MDRYKKLSNNFYSINLHTGKTNIMIGHNIQCFFLVEHLCSEKFIKEQALQLLMTPCRNFDFYGAYSKEWDVGFDLVDIMLHPNDEDWDIVLTSSWEDFESFVDALELVLSCRYSVPCDIYLIYDDERLYKNVLNALLKYEGVRHYHSDWQEILCEMED